MLSNPNDGTLPKNILFVQQRAPPGARSAAIVSKKEGIHNQNGDQNHGS